MHKVHEVNEYTGKVISVICLHSSSPKVLNGFNLNILLDLLKVVK
jgi:hypothetical protein